MTTGIVLSFISSNYIATYFEVFVMTESYKSLHTSLTQSISPVQSDRAQSNQLTAWIIILLDGVASYWTLVPPSDYHVHPHLPSSSPMTTTLTRPLQRRQQ